MALSIDITDADVMTALRTALLAILPTGTPVVQAQQNRAAMPVGGFVQMNSSGMQRLATNVDTFNSDQSESIATQVRYEVQIDFLGPTAQSWAMVVQAAFRDAQGASLFPANIQPLYADDPLQIPLIDAESQYEQRWTVRAALQYNPVITAQQPSATALQIGLKPIDQTFAP